MQRLIEQQGGFDGPANARVCLPRTVTKVLADVSSSAKKKVSQRLGRHLSRLSVPVLKLGHLTTSVSESPKVVLPQLAVGPPPLLRVSGARWQASEPRSLTQASRVTITHHHCARPVLGLTLPTRYSDALARHGVGPTREPAQSP